MSQPTVNLADLANMHTGESTRFDRIKFRFDSLRPVINRLTAWETDFLRSTEFQFTQNGTLTDPQYKTILKIWQNAHKDGFVKLPKGMV